MTAREISRRIGQTELEVLQMAATKKQEGERKREIRAARSSLPYHELKQVFQALYRKASDPVDKSLVPRLLIRATCGCNAGGKYGCIVPSLNKTRRREQSDNSQLHCLELAGALSYFCQFLGPT